MARPSPCEAPVTIATCPFRSAVNVRFALSDMVPSLTSLSHPPFAITSRRFRRALFVEFVSADPAEHVRVRLHKTVRHLHPAYTASTVPTARRHNLAGSTDLVSRPGSSCGFASTFDTTGIRGLDIDTSARASANWPPAESIKGVWKRTGNGQRNDLHGPGGVWPVPPARSQAVAWPDTTIFPGHSRLATCSTSSPASFVADLLDPLQVESQAR